MKSSQTALLSNLDGESICRGTLCHAEGGHTLDVQSWERPHGFKSVKCLLEWRDGLFAVDVMCYSNHQVVMRFSGDRKEVSEWFDSAADLVGVVDDSLIGNWLCERLFNAEATVEYSYASKCCES